MSFPRRLFQRSHQRFQEARAWPRRGAEAGHVLGVHLAIKQLKLPRVKLPDQVDEGDLGGVRLPGEHGFAEEGRAQRDAVEPAD